MGQILKVSGTMNPASLIALFFASAVSISLLAILPAWPNCTSVANILAQVPIAQATMGLRMTPFLDGLNDAVLFDTTNLTEQDEHLAVGIFLVTEEMVNESRARVTITTDSDTLVGTVGDEREDVVKFIGHASRLGNISDGAWAIELRSDDVVHHSAKRDINQYPKIIYNSRLTLQSYRS
jgi:hypothetical protein